MAVNFNLGDSGALHFGVDNEIKLSHVHNTGLTLKHTNNSSGTIKLTLQNNETEITSTDVIGVLDFQAPNEADGLTAVCAGIEAVAQENFATSLNGTKLSFKTTSSGSGSASVKLILDKDGNVTLKESGTGLRFISGGLIYTEIKGSTGLGSSLSFTLPSAYGTSGQFLKSHGNGALSWDSASGSSSGRTITTGTGSVDTGVIKGSVGAISGNNIIVNIVARITTAIVLSESDTLSLDIGTTLDGNDIVNAGFLNTTLTADTISASSSGTHSNTFNLSSGKGYISGATLYFKVYCSIATISSGAMKFYVETIPA